MTFANETVSIVGRGRTEGARLFREWFGDLSNASTRDEKTAYVMVMGSLVELLRGFGFHIVFPEISSLQTAFRHVSDEYLNEAEDYGYSPDICGYVRADVALQLRGGLHPMGQIPAPSLAVFTNGCNTYIKWAEIWERMYGIPIFTLDVPGTRQVGRPSTPGSQDFENDLRYVAGQLDELIARCEEISGRSFDIELLREGLTHTNSMARSYRRILELNQATPAVFDALGDATAYLGMANSFRGTAEGAHYFEQLVEELEYKAANGLGSDFEEAFRLAFIGVPCYPIFRRFSELFTDWGGSFISSSYLWFASGGFNYQYEYDTTRPLESLAEGLLIGVRDSMDSMFDPARLVIDMVEPYQIDGVVFHGIKSCRTVSTGLADSRRVLMEECDIPSLFIESDHMDQRVVSEAQLKNRIDAFFEGLASRKQAANV